MARIGYARVSTLDQDLDTQLARLKGEGCGIVLDPHVSTRGEMGHVVLTVLGMVARMEKRFIRERQREGIERAKGEGTYRGGQRRLDRDGIRTMAGEGIGPAAIARAVGCSRMQVYRVLQETDSS